MKTKILLLTFLTFVFTAIGQITPDLIPGDDNHAAALSPNGEYVVVVADGDIGGIVPDGDGLLKVYHRNDDNTFTLWDKDGDGNGDEHILPKGTTSSAQVLIYQEWVSISNTGDWFVFFQNDHIFGVSHRILMKNNIIISEWTAEISVTSMSAKDGALYMSGTKNSIEYFKKYDMATNNLLWSINPGGNTPYIIKTEGFDPHLKMSNGDLIKFDDATGANLGVVASGDISDIYQINNDGEIEHYHGSNNPIQKLVFPDAEMDWGESNLWASGSVDSWKRIHDKTFLLGSGLLTLMSNDLVHGFKDDPLVPASAGIDLILDSHIFDDGLVTLITYTEGGGSIDDTIDIRHFDYAGDVVVPTLNISGTNVQSVFDGQRYNGTNWIDVYERVGTAVLNGTMPNVGDFADPSLVNVPSGYILVPPGSGSTSDISPIEIDSDGNLFVRFIFYENGATSNLNNLRVYLIHSSALNIDDDNLKYVSIYPNPVSKNITIQNSEFINEINIFNILGQNVLNIKYSENTATEKNKM